MTVIGESCLGYSLDLAVGAYLSAHRMGRKNGTRWANQKEKMLLDFRSWATSRGVDTVEAIQPRHLDEYLETRRRLHQEADSTLNTKAVIIRHLARWSVERNHCDSAPLASLKFPAWSYAVPELPTWERIRRLVLWESHPERQAIYTALLYTGMRRGELFAVRWQDVDLDAGVILIRSTTAWRAKNGKARTVPICAELRPILEERQEREGLAGPFLKDDGKPVLHPNRVSAAFKAHAAAHKMDLRLHSLRHAFATHVIQDLNADPITAQVVLGHSSLRMTQHYVHPGKDSTHRVKTLLDRETKARQKTA